MSQEFKNRLIKNYRNRKKKLKKQGIECFRLYDRDLPDFPYIIDIYKNNGVVYERFKTVQSENELSDKGQFIEELLLNNSELMSLENVFWKKRNLQKGAEQYQKMNSDRGEIVVCEGNVEFLVNLSDYLDTGLFLDHRPLRNWIKNESRDGVKFLNLFCYTASISVCSALSGAKVTSVDLSSSYIEWAKRNFELNSINVNNHRFIKEDCFAFLKEERSLYDLIVLDPPTFSNSKKMTGFLDVQRDHVELIKSCLGILTDTGKLYFSTNLKSFSLSRDLLDSHSINIIDKTKASIDFDFRDEKIHHCFEISKK